VKTPIKLGTKVRDKLTGYTGIAESRHEYIDGSVSYGVRREWTAGDYPSSAFVSAAQIEVIV
jgi:hypothetical protein